MLKKLSILSFLVLTSCSSDIYELPLSNVNFDDVRMLERLASELPAEEKVALATYTLIHRPDSPAFCGDVLVDDNGALPTTVGQAIQFTIIREEKLRLSRLEAGKPPTEIEKERARRDLVIARQEQLFARRALLFSEHGAAAKNLEEWHKIAEELENTNYELAKFESTSSKS